MHRVLTSLTDHDTSTLKLDAGEFNILPAPLFGQERDSNSDNLAVNNRGKPGIGFLNSLFYFCNYRGVIRGKDEGFGIRRGDGRELHELEALTPAVHCNREVFNQ